MLKTLLMEFKDIAKEARKIFTRYNVLGGDLNIMRTLKIYDARRMKYGGQTEYGGRINLPTPFKILGIFTALEENFVESL